MLTQRAPGRWTGAPGSTGAGLRVRFLLEDADLLADVDPRLAAHLQRTVTAPLVQLGPRSPALLQLPSRDAAEVAAAAGVAMDPAVRARSGRPAWPPS